MIDFVGIPPLLRIALQVAMATMHFRIVQTGLYFRNIVFCFKGTQETNLAPIRNTVKPVLSKRPMETLKSLA